VKLFIFGQNNSLMDKFHRQSKYLVHLCEIIPFWSEQIFDGQNVHERQLMGSNIEATTLLDGLMNHD